MRIVGNTGQLTDSVESVMRIGEALSLQFSGIWIPAYVVSIPSTPGTKNSFK